MTTSSSETSRCTRISPSAVLDDRLDGKDLEWARDHLRRCEACRERVEEFREMLLRVGRLPKATIGATAIDQAFAASIPETLRDEVGDRSFPLAGAETGRIIPPIPDLPAPIRPELSGAGDVMSQLEREIFRDEPAQDHPTALTPSIETATPDTPTESVAADHQEATEAEHPSMVEEPDEEPVASPLLPLAEPIVAAAPSPSSWREIPIDSHRAVAADLQLDEPDMTISSPPEHRNVIYEQQAALLFEEPEAISPSTSKKSDNAMRIAVGFGAAACVLLAALLYEGGYVLKAGRFFGAVAPAATASARVSSTPRPSASASATPLPSKPPASVLYTLGTGAPGGTVFRIRPGTAVAGYTRLVFDIRGGGLPSMIITRPDDSHVEIIFKNATVTGVPVSGIRSYHVAAVEPGVQQGPDGSFTVDLAHPARVTAFTLPATGSYAWRLVVDLHTS
jgi:cell division septation protein DedD